MKAIVFIGTMKSGSSRDAISAAKELGYFTVLLTENKKQLIQREEYTDVHLMKYCDLKNLQEVQNVIQELQVAGFVICAIVSFVDSYVHLAASLGEMFGVNRFTTKAAYFMENKLRSREVLKDTPYAPKYCLIDGKREYTFEELKPYIPGILKAPTSTGSKDVYKVDNYTDFLQKLKRLKSRFNNQTLILEEYLDGPQYLVEVMVYRGLIRIVAIVEQEITYVNNHFIVTGYYLNLDGNGVNYFRLREAVRDIVRLHGLREGVCHLEMRLVNNQWKLVEINPRISGGGMNQLISAGFGINYVREILRLSLNEKPDISPKHRRHHYIKYKLADKEGVLKKVTGKATALKSPGVVKVYVKPRKGNLIYLPKTMGHRYAYALASGNNKLEAKENAENALDKINFIIDTEIAVTS